ncbi:MAG: MFS transporter [Gemmataceae bacterium]|nr:MFS transporter [Gemmataceae bacterium]
MTGSLELVPATLASAFTCGAALALMGSIRQSLARRLGVTESRAWVFSAGISLALVPAMLLGGIVTDRSGVEWVLIGGSLLTAVAVALLALSQRYTGSLAAVLAVAAASACVAVGSNVLMPGAFFPDATVQYAPAAINLGNTVLVLGTLIAPLAAEIGIRRFGFRRTMGVTALLCLLPALAAALTPADRFPAFRADDVDKVLAEPVLWIAGIAFLLYGPLESMIGTWANTYLAELGFSARRAAGLHTGFWLAFLLSRLLSAFALQHDWVTSGHEPLWLVLVPALCAGIVLGNLAGATSRPSAAWGVLLLAVFLGPILPTMIGFVYRRFPQAPGTAIGASLALEALGSMFLLPAIGLYARRTTVRKALQLPAVVALLLAGTVLVLHLLPHQW